ncbi:MAG: hypothetical protein P1U34_07230 [Coxiellaceae bacterium]|nr:hypothetical protein [Coxiellaceae bacterium]
MKLWLEFLYILEMVDCSNITNSDLTQQVPGLWEPNEHTTVIPYSFNGALSREQLLPRLDDNMMAKMSGVSDRSFYSVKMRLNIYASESSFQCE